MGRNKSGGTVGFSVVPDNLTDCSSKLGGGVGLLEWIVLVSVWRFQHRGNPCYLTNKHLADATNTNERTITRAITKLQGAGMLTVEVNQKKNKLKSPRLLTLTEATYRAIEEINQPIDKMSTGLYDLSTKCLQPIDKMSIGAIDKMSTKESILENSNKNITPYSPPCDFSPALSEAFIDWIVYKKERRESYKETGYKNLVTQVRKSATTYGDTAVIEQIRNSIASGYRGITFDRLKKNAQSGSGKSPPAYYDPDANMRMI